MSTMTKMLEFSM